MNTKRQTKTPTAPVVAVAIPPPTTSLYPFETMGIQEGFVVPNDQENSVRSMASRYKRKLGRTFTVRRLSSKEASAFGKKGPNWVGVWRIS